MIKIKKLNKNDIGLAFSCTKDSEIWGSKSHQNVNHFLMDNLSHGLYAYAVTYDENPAGHLIIVKTNTLFSPIEAENSIFIYCLYIASEFRSKNLANIILSYMEDDMKKNYNIKAIFVQSFESKNMNPKFFINQGYSEIEKYELNSLFVKTLNGIPNYKINTFDYSHSSKKNVLIVNYNPLCPLILNQYKTTVNYIKKYLPEIEIEEHYIETLEDIKKFGYYGIFFNNIPLLINLKKPDELKEMLKTFILP